MSQDDFQYRPVNSTRRPKKKLFDFSKFPKLPKFKKGEKWDAKTIFLWICIGIVGAGVAGVILLSIFIAILSIGLPDVKDLDKLAVAQSTTIYDREGNILYTKHGGENRQYVPIDQMSDNIINATVAIEDDQFWTHSGFDPTAIARAVLGQVTGAAAGGGSTITQQYVKNAFLSPEQTYTRKLKELILSVRLEQEFDKEKILELYLNKIPYGNNAYGVQKAAEIYFDKDAADLTLAESVILASLPQRPTYYNPYGEHRDPVLTRTFTAAEASSINEEADLDVNDFWRGLIGGDVALDEESTVYIRGRTDFVLAAMEKNGYISQQEMDAALDELQNFEFQKYAAKINAPHFVFYIIEQLEETYGQEVVEQGGLNVYTSIDPKLQEIAETAVAEGAAHNTENFNVKNGMLVALDPKTGEVLAMVGSKDYFAEDIDGAVNIATQYRQPGSSFKPIVYAQAFYNRYAPASVIFDVRTRFGSNSYPQNYDGGFQGPISIRKALAQSRNIPAIKAYYLAGEMEPILELAQNMGVKFLDTEREYGWPLSLGAAEVQPLSMVSSFGTFANGGIYHEPISILKVENAQGEILDEYKIGEGTEALDPQIAYLINDILSDESVRLGPTMSVPGRKVATKTGTSTDPDGDARDLWTIGYTPNLVAGVWTGNNKADEGKPAKNASGYTNAAPIWKDFMSQALQDYQSEDFHAPEGITTASVSKLTGKLPGPGTPDDQIVEEIFASFSVPTEVDDSITQADIDTRNMKLANEYCPPTYVNTISFIGLRAIADIGAWQEGVDAWMEANSQDLFSGQTGESEGEEGQEATPSILTTNFFFGLPPSETSELCTKDNLEDAPKVKIDSPKKNAQIESGINLDVEIDIDAKNDIEKVEYYVDDQFNYRASSSPFNGTVRLPKGETSKTSHTISVIVTDEFGYIAEASVKITTSPDNGSGNNNNNNNNNNDEEDNDQPAPPPQEEDPNELPPEEDPEDPIEDTIDEIIDDLPVEPNPTDLPTI